MLKKSLAAVVLFATIGVPTVAHAAPAVSGVQLGWDSAGVRVSWSESAAVANTITVTRPGQPAKQVGTTAANGANQLFVDSRTIGSSSDPAEAVFITVAATGGGEAKSAVFDTYLRPPSYSNATLNSRVLSWYLGPDTAVDGTPNDPLDQGGPVSITPIMKFADCTVKSQASTTALHGSIPNQARPFNLTLQGANEWGREVFDSAPVRTSAITLAAPASTPYDAPIAFAGQVSVRHVVEGPNGCTEADDPNRARIQVILHARDSATSPWYVVNTANTDAQGNYHLSVANRRNREYRVWVGENSLSANLQYGSVSATKSVVIK
jgi:hypothetical protein